MIWDRSIESLRAIVRAIVGQHSAGPVDYLAPYRGKVISQSSDLAYVDVQLDDERIPSPSNVPLRLGTPGTKVQVPPGVYVVVGFDGGDPQLPFAHLWDSGSSALKITIAATTQVTVDGGPLVDINGTSVTVGPNPILAVLVQGAFDSMGVPVQQSPTSLGTLKSS